MLKERYKELLNKKCSTRKEYDARYDEMNWLNQEMGRLRDRQEYRQKNSRELFMESQGYIIHDPDGVISCQSLYEQYCIWCRDHTVTPYSVRGLTLVISRKQGEYRLVPVQNIRSLKGTHIRGYRGLRLWEEADGPAQRFDPEDLPRTYTPPKPVIRDVEDIRRLFREHLQQKESASSQDNADHMDKQENNERPETTVYAVWQHASHRYF